MAIQYLWRLIITFHKEHPEKLTITSLSINSVPLLIRPIAKLKPRAKISTK